MPTMTNAGRLRGQRRPQPVQAPARAPRRAQPPITIDGPNTPPEPPLPMVRLGRQRSCRATTATEHGRAVAGRVGESPSARCRSRTTARPARRRFWPKLKVEQHSRPAPVRNAPIAGRSCGGIGTGGTGASARRSCGCRASPGRRTTGIEQRRSRASSVGPLNVRTASLSEERLPAEEQAERAIRHDAGQRRRHDHFRLELRRAVQHFGGEERSGQRRPEDGGDAGPHAGGHQHPPLGRPQSAARWPGTSRTRPRSGRSALRGRRNRRCRWSGRWRRS